MEKLPRRQRVVSSETRSSVKHTHAGAAQDLGGRIGVDAHAEDVNAGGIDVHSLAKVGEVGADVGLSVNGADGDGVGRRAG